MLPVFLRLRPPHRGGPSAALVLTLVAAAAAGVALFTPNEAPAGAQPAAPAELRGTILYVKGNQLVSRAARGGSPRILAALPADLGALSELRAAGDGHLVVLEGGNRPAWWLADDDRIISESPCAGDPEPSPSGGFVLCEGDSGPLFVGERPPHPEAEVPHRLDALAFAGPAGTFLVGRGDKGVLGFDWRAPRELRTLARVGAVGRVLVAPDGEKAVAVFGRGETSRIRVFALDGGSASRQLGGPAVPLVWSPDSAWLLFDEGLTPADGPGAGGAPTSPEGSPGEGSGEEPRRDDDGDGDGNDRAADGGGELGPSPWLLLAPDSRDRARAAARAKARTRDRARARERARRAKEWAQDTIVPSVRACVARAAGGEVKCWDGFHGLAFSPDSTRVLLKKGNALFVGLIAGVRPAPPTELVDGVDGPATWLP